MSLLFKKFTNITGKCLDNGIVFKVLFSDERKHIERLSNLY